MTPDAAPPPPSARPPRPSVFRTTLLTLAGSLALLLALVAGLRYWVWPDLDRWRDPIASLASVLLGRAVQIERLSGSWTEAAPSLQIEGLRIDAPDGQAGLSVAQLNGRLSAKALWSGELRFATLEVHQAVLHGRLDDQGQLYWAGWRMDARSAGKGLGLGWLLRQDQIRLKAGRLVLDEALAQRLGTPQTVFSLNLDRVGRRHELHVRALTEGGAGEVTVVADWEHPLWADPAALASWTGRAYLGVHAPGAASATPSGQGQLWTTFARGKGPRLVMHLDGTAREGLSGQARAQIDMEASDPDAPIWRGAIRALSMQAPSKAPESVHGPALTPSRLNGAGAIALHFEPDQVLPGLSGRIEFEPLDLSGLAQEGRRQTSSWPQALAQLAWSGRMEGLSLQWQRTAQVSDWFWEGQLVDVGVARPPNSDGTGEFDISGLQGRLIARPQELKLQLDAGPMQVHLPGIFQDPSFRLTRLQGIALLRPLPSSDPTSAGRWGLEVPELRFADADLSGTARLRWTSAPSSPGELQLSANIDRIGASKVVRYLPLAVGAQTRAWLTRAVRSGSIEKIEAQVRGDLGAFPFRDPATGMFRVSGRVRDATLDYAPGWPRLEGLDGQLVFERAGFDLSAARARLHGTPVRELRANLPEYREAELSITALAEGAAQNMLDFIDESPLASTISSFTRDLRVAGDAELNLSLAIPLLQAAQTRAQGVIRLPGNDLQLDRTLPLFRGLAGQIEFTESTLELRDLSAMFLGGEVQVQGRTTAPGRMHIEARGRADAAAVQAVIDNALTRALSGAASYEASIDVDRRASSLRLRSDLIGLVSRLPAPLAKTAEQPLWLEVVSQPLSAPRPDARPPGDRLHVRLGPDMRLSLERRRDERTDRLRVQGAGFGLGVTPVLPASGLTAAMRTDHFNFDAWRALLAQTDVDALERQTTESVLPGFALVPDRVSVVADRLTIAGTALNQVVIGATRQAGRWSANIAAREISGQFEWLDARPGEPIGTLRARFDRLSLPRSREAEIEAALARPPEHLPALDVSVESLELGRVSLGRLSLRAENEGSAIQPVWALRHLEIDNPHARLSAQGRWAYQLRGAPERPPSERRRTELELDLEIRDAGGLLERFGIDHAVRNAPGLLRGRLQWQGSPMAVDLPSLQGAMQLSLAQGAFLRVDPGAARWVAVLNLQSVARLLSGDLIEIFREGFAFDEIRGTVEIREGVTRTSDLRMRGPQATVALKGVADLQRETQSLHVVLTPELNASLASIAVGAMVNPAAGLGSLAAQYVLRKPLQAALALEFDIDGPWAEPRVRVRSPRLPPTERLP